MHYEEAAGCLGKELVWKKQVKGKKVPVEETAEKKEETHASAEAQNSEEGRGWQSWDHRW